MLLKLKYLVLEMAFLIAIIRLIPAPWDMPIFPAAIALLLMVGLMLSVCVEQVLERQ